MSTVSPPGSQPITGNHFYTWAKWLATGTGQGQPSKFPQTSTLPCKSWPAISIYHVACAKSFDVPARVLASGTNRRAVNWPSPFYRDSLSERTSSSAFHGLANTSHCWLKHKIIKHIIKLLIDLCRCSLVQGPPPGVARPARTIY